MCIEARDQAEIRTARLHESFFATNPNLFQRLQAIRNERRADDDNLFDPVPGKPIQLKFRISLQQRTAASLDWNEIAYLFDGRLACLVNSATVLKHCAR